MIFLFGVIIKIKLFRVWGDRNRVEWRVFWVIGRN